MKICGQIKVNGETQATEDGWDKEGERDRKQGRGREREREKTEKRDREAESDRDRKGPWPPEAVFGEMASLAATSCVASRPHSGVHACAVLFRAESGLACVTSRLWQRKQCALRLSHKGHHSFGLSGKSPLPGWKSSHAAPWRAAPPTETSLLGHRWHGRGPPWGWGPSFSLPFPCLQRQLTPDS